MSDLPRSAVLVTCDTREQAPFDLEPLRMEPGTLATGDYVLTAAPGWCCIERKSGPDLLACLGRERQRFQAELDRMRAFGRRGIVLVEANLPDLLHDTRAKLSPESIIGSLAAWQGRYCGFVFAGSRAQAEDYARRFLYCCAAELWRLSESFKAATEGAQAGDQ